MLERFQNCKDRSKYKARKSKENPNQLMKESLSDKEKRASGKPWHLQKWQPAAGKNELGEGRRGGFMVMLVQMETHS